MGDQEVPVIELMQDTLKRVDRIEDILTVCSKNDAVVPVAQCAVKPCGRCSLRRSTPCADCSRVPPRGRHLLGANALEADDVRAFIARACPFDLREGLEGVVTWRGLAHYLRAQNEGLRNMLFAFA